MGLVKQCSIGLIATLSLSFSFGWIQKTSAAESRCQGASCKDKNPVEYGCDADGSFVEQVITTVYRWQDSWQPQQIIIEKTYSKSCNATWTRAYIPSETFLFIRDQAPINGSEQIHGLFQANGTGYFWSNSNMAPGRSVNQACVALQSIPLPGLGYLYDRHCTSFN
ncbi:hypothetical protein [Leptolyngbya sp. FACHB-261]|uniref:hypothetical protein n=1 Tax=Leptolyngbya sp. FACHB-261 TaxID=2692806 RepID=UPI00168A317E|nr:hypothetical protein [Leptolyngbya sp. FACHB-261]MBD2103362.1 hypothetical protein [Leptolyngbya sp. FACHB-261]